LRIIIALSLVLLLKSSSEPIIFIIDTPESLSNPVKNKIYMRFSLSKQNEMSIISKKNLVLYQLKIIEKIISISKD